MATVLIIDDSADFVYVLSTRLQLDGYTVHLARDGATGLEMARAVQPHVIILDLQMPHLSGHQVWTRLQQDPALATIPVLIFSSRPQYTDTFWKDKRGPRDYFMKGATLEPLLARIREVTKPYADRGQ